MAKSSHRHPVATESCADLIQRHANAV